MLVRELLALPRMHLIVDGYNVTRAEWDDVTLEAQRNRLLRGLAPLVAQTGAEITVVFDGTNAETRPLVRPPRGVRVLFSPRGVLADDVIRDLVAAEPGAGLSEWSPATRRSPGTSGARPAYVWSARGPWCGCWAEASRDSETVAAHRLDVRIRVLSVGAGTVCPEPTPTGEGE